MAGKKSCKRKGGISSIALPAVCVSAYDVAGLLYMWSLSLTAAKGRRGVDVLSSWKCLCVCLWWSTHTHTHRHVLVHVKTCTYLSLVRAPLRQRHYHVQPLIPPSPLTTSPNTFRAHNTRAAPPSVKYRTVLSSLPFRFVCYNYYYYCGY